MVFQSVENKSEVDTLEMLEWTGGIAAVSVEGLGGIGFGVELRSEGGIRSVSCGLSSDVAGGGGVELLIWS